MVQILSAEQPCVFCGMTLHIVTLHKDALTGAERIEREELAHDDAECARMVTLYAEIWPRLPGY